MPEALVTFLMPLKYYREDFLRQALRSVFLQSCQEWRLLIIAEPPDHATFAALLRDELEDSRVELEVMSGRPFSGSINSGMRLARTEFVALLFGDDLLAHDAVRVLSEAIRSEPDVDFFHSSRQMMDERGQRVGSVMPSRERFSLDDFKWGSPVKHLMCWRREMGLAVGGLDESLVKAVDDYDFPWTMAEHGAVFKAVRECLYLMRNHCAYYRRTTHIPRSVARRGIRRILGKHGVGFWRRNAIVARRFRGVLGKQCVYRNSVDRWVKERLRIDPRRSWRAPRAT
jgi:hypothetical protein